MRLQILDSQANFTCGGCTKCCTQPYAVIIEKDKAEALAKHDFSAYPQLAGKTLFTASKDAPEGYQVLPKQPGTTRCLFLADDGLCLIHKEMGADAKPHPCLRYPYLGSTTFVDDRISLDFGCPHVQASEGKPLTEQEDELRKIFKESNVPVLDKAFVALNAETGLQLDEYNALVDRIEGIFARPDGTSIWSRFAEVLVLVDTVDKLKRSGPENIAERLRNGEPELETLPMVRPFDAPQSAPSPVRMAFASTLMRDVLPPDVTLNMSLIGRVMLLPKLMSLAKLSGRYDSKFLGYNVDVDQVLAHPVEPQLDAGATELLQRYYRSRIWQRFLVGTRLSVTAGIHQHILDLNAILFLARAEAQHRGQNQLTEALIGKGLSHVELNIANQPRLFSQKSLSWFTGQLDSVPLAMQSLRLMALPRTDVPRTEDDGSETADGELLAAHA
jgi:Fe-S-cluster containining protein